jgi:hypothetical protein
MKLKRLLWLIVLELLGFWVAASAQTISPLIGEGGKGRIRGQFTIDNPALQPLVASVEARSVSFTKEGGVVSHALDSGVEVQLAETSAKIGAKQRHSFDYTVKCERLCAVVFQSSSYAGRTKEGMLVRVVLLHFVYLCPDGAKGCREKVRRSFGIAPGQ